MFNRTHAQASPSVTLEKGIARLRPQRVAPPRHVRQSSPTNDGGKPAAVLAAIAFAILLAVCLALYLLSRGDRWDLSPISLSTLSKLRMSSASNDPFLTPLPDPRTLPHDTDTPTSKTQHPSEQFLSYLPHSGFHNQRIALENALVLSYILNRTLLIPPVLLGEPVLRYRPFASLRIDLAHSSKAGLEHCALVPKAIYIPEECSDYWTHAHVPWEWFVDLSPLREQYGIKTLVQWDFTDASLASLHLKPSETYFLIDTDAYQFRFFDSATDEKALGSRYMTRVDLPTLIDLAQGHRLLQLGTLFGTTRVRLSNPVHLSLRGSVHRAMVFTNADLLAIADGIRDSSELGGGWKYAAVHLRLGDGVFADGAAREQNVRFVWWKLVRALGMSDEDALRIESKSRGVKGVRIAAPTQTRDAADLRVPHPPPPPLKLPLSVECQRRPIHPLLNVPLYIATDKPHHHALSLFRHTFPCVYFLSNFSVNTARLETLSVSSAGKNNSATFDSDGSPTSPSDEVWLAPFLPPFLDAIIASKARIVVGTPGSTFSRFVEDVLWRAYHGWNIVHRG